METHSIFKYTTERNGIHFIPHDKIEQFKKDPLFKNDEINEKLKADAYGLSPIFIINPKNIKTFYTPLYILLVILFVFLYKRSLYILIFLGLIIKIGDNPYMSALSFSFISSFLNKGSFLNASILS